MESPRCQWCHEYHDIMYEKMVPVISRLGIPNGEDVEFFCSETCFENASQYLRLCSRASIPFTILLFLIVGAIVASPRLASALGLPLRSFLGLCLLPAGVCLQFVPFTTPETVQYLGMEKGRWMMRMVGIFLIIFAFAFIV